MIKRTKILFYILMCLFVSTNVCSDEVDDRYWSAIDKIENELSTKYSSNDSEGLFQRRKRLREYFGSIPPKYSMHLHDTLVNQTNELAPLFYSKLATAARNEIFSILLEIDLNYAKNNVSTETQYSTSAEEVDDNYWAVIDNIETELSTKYNSNDSEGLFQRRERLREYFGSIPPKYSLHLHDTLVNETNEISPLFYSKLATATRNELISILKELNFNYTDNNASSQTQYSTNALDTYDGEVDFCASEPPPVGLKDRCYFKDYKLAEFAVYLDFKKEIVEWMETCVSTSRASLLVDESDSLRGIWSLLSDDKRLRGKTFRINPLYTPLRWENDNGATCYGVKSVKFYLKRERGNVTPEGFTLPEDGFEIKPGPVEDQIVKASRYARKVLLNGNESGEWVSKMRCVLDIMEDSGERFDGTYFPVAPVRNGTDNPPACFKEGTYGPNGYGYSCRTGQDALDACKQSFTNGLVNKVENAHNDAEIFEWLAIRGNELTRSRQFLDQSHLNDGVMSCKSVRTHIKPAIKALANKNSVYYCFFAF